MAAVAGLQGGCMLSREQSNPLNAMWVTDPKPLQLVVGLDGAGKTALVAAAAGNPAEATRPTVGFSRPLTLEASGFRLTLYDLGGAKGIRSIWSEYVAEVHAVVFVVDGADSSRLMEARSALHDLMKHSACAGKSVLLFCNKADLGDSMEADAVAAAVRPDPDTRCAETRACAAPRCKLLFQWQRHPEFAPTTLCRLICQPCSSKASDDGQADTRIAQGIRKLLEAIRAEFEELDSRVQWEHGAYSEQEASKRAQRLANGKAARAAREQVMPCHFFCSLSSAANAVQFTQAHGLVSVTGRGAIDSSNRGLGC